jgi:Spy/CpxP family protein refolding chaperone
MKRRMTMLTVMMAMMLGTGAAALAQADDAPPPRDGQSREGRAPRGEWRSGDWRRGDSDRAHGGMRPGSHGDQDPGYNLTDEQIEQILEVVEDYRPEMAEQISEMRERDPQRAEQLLRRAMMFVRPMVQMKQVDPEGYELHLRDAKLDRESRELARRVRAADGREADDLRAQLREVVAQHFDVRQRIRERKLAALEKQIDELRTQIETRAESRDQLVDQRYGELTGQSQRPEW